MTENDKMNICEQITHRAWPSYLYKLIWNVGL